MKASHCQQFAVRREIQRRDHRRPRINRWMLGVIMPLGIGRGVIFRPLLDPRADQRHVRLHQRGFALRHAHLAVLGRDHLQDRALLRMPRDNGRTLGIAARQQPLEIRHYVAALGFRRLMASLAVRLEDRTDFAIVTDLGCGFSVQPLVFSRVAVRGKKKRQRQTEKQVQQENSWWPT